MQIKTLTIIFVLLLAAPRALADNKIPAPPEYSAVPPVTVLNDEHGDYVLDEPFGQWWQHEPQDLQSYGLEPLCSGGLELIPDWAKPLPVESTRCARLNSSETELWIATQNGLIYLNLENRRKLYFAGDRWLSDNNVLNITPSLHEGRERIRTLTLKGPAFISRSPMTLEEKALYFEKINQERHNREGMITTSGLAVAGDVSSFVLDDDDNDGQWTEMYLAAECFRYAATGDPTALENARESFRAMEKLLTIAPVKGYPARSVLPADKCPGKDAGNWRMLPSGKECWKSDTSVDELVGHYFGLPIFYDLAANEEEKERIRELITDMTDYLLDNGLRLLDENGKVTTHGNWDPEWVNTVGRTGDQGLNSLQALSALRSAYHVTGNEKYFKEYMRLIKDHGYHKNVLKSKEISDRFQVNHDSDEMAVLSFYNLIRYEDNEKLRDKYYLEGLRRLWENDLPERNPEQIIIYGAFARRDFALDLAVRTLREIPLDLVNWGVSNSHRADIDMDTDQDRFQQPQNRFALPYTEARTMRWSINMYQLDTDGAGRSEADATFWLLPYWMARHHNLIRPVAN